MHLKIKSQQTDGICSRAIYGVGPEITKRYFLGEEMEHEYTEQKERENRYLPFKPDTVLDFTVNGKPGVCFLTDEETVYVCDDNGKTIDKL